MKKIKKLMVVCFTISFSFYFAGCGKNQNSAKGEIELTKSDVIVADTNWFETSRLRHGSLPFYNAKAVGDITIPTPETRCTGFIVAPYTVMTNHHCFPYRSYLTGVTISFNHEAGVSEHKIVKHKCDKLVGRSWDLDFVLLECDDPLYDKYGMVKLSDEVPDKGDDIYVIQQNCDYYTRDCDWTKKVSLGKILYLGKDYLHNADTLGGSSGSPVFSFETSKVIALHHQGYRFNNEGRGYYNMAVPMNKIISYIVENYPQIDLNL